MRLVLRRFEPFPLILAPVWLILIVLVLWSKEFAAQDIAVAVVVFSLVALFCHLQGPVLQVVVTPQHLVVANTFFRHRVPRRMIDDVVGTDFGVKVRLVDGDTIAVAMFDPAVNGVTAKSARWYQGRSRRLVEAMEAVPSEVSPDHEVERSARYGNMFTLLVFVLIIASGIGYVANA
ncbi:hypothetical protein [Micromonospora sp. C95]|uniref:hypothetical protein n=1 Tax=Micromonospora sp. C95 TaxID=2824882 RepID=UPI001B371FF6|nr:hypothetical protein [Micromonospora sp. C95]MBQ1026206.1 hypothetical protein [Micromonospora sp. C95]